jgi:preprotein translocase subunit YajC
MLGPIVLICMLLAQDPAKAPAPVAGGGAPAAAAPPGPTVAAGAPDATAPPGGATTPPAPAAKPAEPNAIASLLPLPLIFVLFYFLMIRPQQQQEKKRKESLNLMEKNARVLTAAGMYGTVISVDKDTVLLRLGSDPGVKVECTKASIVRIIDDTKEKTKEV